MKDQACRRCGESIIDAEKCPKCHQANKFLCPECNVIYEDFHSNCCEFSQIEKVVIN